MESRAESARSEGEVPGPAVGRKDPRVMPAPRPDSAEGPVAFRDSWLGGDAPSWPLRQLV